jgi:hypothetical protein
MNDSAVLAAKFVPSKLREINTAVPNQCINAPEIPTLAEDIRKLQGKLQPLPACLCSSSKHVLHVPHVDVTPETTFALLPTDSTKKNLQDKIMIVDKISNIRDYLETFRALLLGEREEVLRLYERYSQYDVLVNPISATHARIIAPGIADAKPPIYAGDIVLLRPLRNMSLPMPNRKKEWSKPVFAVQFNAMVVNVTRSKRDTIAFTWVPLDMQHDMAKTYPERKYNVRILPATMMQERCLTALAWLSTLPQEVSDQLLFPNEAPSVQEVEKSKQNLDHLSQLNSKQQLFVRLVQARTLQSSVDVIRPPMILTGPAGTGKTRTLLASIFEVLNLSNEHRVLVCAPSHTAADVVTQRLAQRLSEDELWRLLDSNRPVETLPAAIFPFTRQTKETGTFRLPSTVAELFKFRVIVCTCSDAHILYKLGFTNHQLRVRRQCFASFSQETCRNLNLEVGVLGEDVTRPHFTHLFVDEASQATEPETMIPFSVVVDPEPGSIKAEIGLIGDPRQLSPNIYCKEASDAGLGRSYMERLLQRPMNYLSGGWPYMLGPANEDVPFDMQHQRSAVFLTANYRGHASFLMMPSSLFYFDKLEVVDSQSTTDWISKLRRVEALSEPVTDLALQWNLYSPIILRGSGRNAIDPAILQVRRTVTWPVHFRGVVGQDASMAIETFAGSNSWCNLKEAEAVAEIVSSLIENGVSSSSIGIMSPFRGQVVVIRKLLRQRNLPGVDVGTIEDYQAVEREVIVLSLTRSSGQFLSHDVEGCVGVFQQVKRTNVALTRAENLFIVVGNPHLMVQDPIWKQWLWFCLRNGIWYGEKISCALLEEMQSKPINIASFRSGESHPLLGPSDELENSVIVSSLERERRNLLNPVPS